MMIPQGLFYGDETRRRMKALLPRMVYPPSFLLGFFLLFFFLDTFFHANSRSSGKQGVECGGCYLPYRKMHNISFRGKGDYRWSRNHKWGIFFGGSSSQCFLLIRSMSNAHFMLKTTVFPILNRVLSTTSNNVKKMVSDYVYNKIEKSF